MRFLKNSSLLLILVVIGFTVAGCGALSPKSEVVPQKLVEVHFTPFEVETFAPLKRANIELQGHCHWQMSETDLHLVLDGAWRRAEAGTVDDRVIRLKADFGEGDLVFIDRDGGIEWQPQKGQRKLTDSDLQVIAVTMRRIAKTYGCKYA